MDKLSDKNMSGLLKDDVGLWRHTILDDICDLVQEYISIQSFSASQYISTENLIPNRGGVQPSLEYPTTAIGLRYKPGDILISNIRPYLKKIWLANHNGACSTDIIVLRSRGEVSSQLLYHLLSRDNFFTYVMNNAVGTKMPRGDRQIIRLYPVAFPCDKRQQGIIIKILSSVDKKILLTRKTLEKYESIKKATVKKLMTPDEGWKRISLSELCDDYGYGVSASAKEYDGENKYIRITDIDDSSHNFIPSPLASPSFFSDKHIVHMGDILFARTGASVGKSYLFNPHDGKLIYAGFLIKFHINSSKANPAFIFQCTLANEYWQWVAIESARTGQPGLNLEQYMQWKVCIPDIEHQNAIVYKLSTYDNKISELGNTLNNLINIKQSMLQYYFG